jgi:hypothetical protein
MTEKSPRARVSLAFLQGKDAGIQTGGKGIVARMTGNPELPNPPVNLTEFDTLLNSYSDAITACVDGGKLATATRNSLRAKVTHNVRLLAAYVDSVANGDEAIIRSSGFESWIYSRSQPQHLETPAPIKLQQGNSGEFYITITRVEGARNYKLRSGVAETDPETWQSRDVTLTRPATLISGLTPGVIYTFQVSALGHLGWTNWSDPVSRMVI